MSRLAARTDASKSATPTTVGQIHACSHRRPQLATVAGGVLGLVTVPGALQVFGQRLALGLAPGFNGCGLALRTGLGLQGFELGFQAGLVGGQCFLEHLALPGVHAFGPGTKAPGLQSRQLMRDALDLCVPELDGLRLLAALGNRANMAFRARFCRGQEVRRGVDAARAVTGMDAGQWVVVRTASRAGQ